MSRLAQATPDDIREAIKNWIDETSNDNIEQLWNEWFDEDITYEPEQGVFEISVDEAERNGIELLY